MGTIYIAFGITGNRLLLTVGNNTMPIFKKKISPLCGVYSENEFRALLEHERKRADRTGDKFSIALFDIPNSNEDMNNACLLPDLITDVVRSTDEVGWLDQDHIGVLLVGTPREGAHEVVKKFSRKMAPDQYLGGCRIFTYPSHYFLDKERPAPGTPDPRIPQQIKLFEEEDMFVDIEGPHGEFPAKGGLSREDGEEACTGNDLELESHLGIEIPVWKRVFDILIATTALIVPLPFLILIATWVKIVSPGPVLFRQERIGYLGKRFNLLKFRTMKVNTDTAIHESYVRDLIRTETVMKKLKDDSQLIPFGKFLRSSGMDELPQLLNVLSGTMSLVGPRPCLPIEFQEYLLWHKRRFYTLPGITGLWQVEGKNKITFREMIRKDIAYEQKRSLKMDFYLVLRTLPAIFKLVNDG